MHALYGHIPKLRFPFAPLETRLRVYRVVVDSRNALFLYTTLVASHKKSRLSATYSPKRRVFATPHIFRCLRFSASQY